METNYGGLRYNAATIAWPVLGLLGTGGMPLHDVVGVNCTMSATT